MDNVLRVREMYNWFIATAYGKLNRVDIEDEQAIPLDQILVQPFTATDDPRALDMTNHHHALCDAEACAAIALKLL